MVVVDASVAVKWFVPEADWPAARRLLALDLAMVAPDILALETMGALLRKHRRREVADGLPAQALGMLAALRVEAVPHGPLLREAAALSLQRRHPIYDCLYLLVAQRRGLPLATFDLRLAALAESLAIPLWSPDRVQELP
ncbi:type II toxin-antitoxin system VapC family toxin [Dankookia sp. GCM10030260]|uniref:type II toxin-antitoxin system VapC family toxin n=1 Tax=Dankookia sp. GCM10030260 TaxID=3273390 RepID=UPI00361DC224